MTPKQMSLIVTGATVTLSGLAYLLFRPLPSTSLQDWQDAGFPAICAPVIVECEGWLENDCRDLPDGGLRRKYVTLKLQAVQCEQDGGVPLLWIRSPRHASTLRDCFHPLGKVSQACEVVDSACTDPELCEQTEEPPSKPAAHRCACRNVDAGPCVHVLADGGFLPRPRNMTIPPPFGGAGCVRKPCVELFGGESSMPAECL